MHLQLMLLFFLPVHLMKIGSICDNQGCNTQKMPASKKGGS